MLCHTYYFCVWGLGNTRWMTPIAVNFYTLVDLLLMQIDFFMSSIPEAIWGSAADAQNLKCGFHSYENLALQCNWNQEKESVREHSTLCLLEISDVQLCYEAHVSYSLNISSVEWAACYGLYSLCSYPMKIRTCRWDLRWWALRRSWAPLCSHSDLGTECLWTRIHLSKKLGRRSNTALQGHRKRRARTFAWSSFSTTAEQT